ncbi:MAG: type I 3-dehydroquinate dehydratase [Eubacteriales bacterium]|nr:type I 3-dehydroquinate dehydratase [Eubacteriales bacterium]
MPSVNIKGVLIGEGLPKICVPLTDTNTESLRKSLSEMKQHEFDLIEWRADKFAGLFNKEALIEASELIRSEFPDTPLIFTIRTRLDMDNFEISDLYYKDINLFVSDYGLADLIDIEYSHGDSFFRDITNDIHKNGVKVIASKHVASSTPEVPEIVDLLIKMQDAGADIVKFASMPCSERDVLKLIDATLTMKEKHNDTPVITMSMGRMGVISRICGSLTGSALTFGTIGAASAPGQFSSDELKRMLETIG